MEKLLENKLKQDPWYQNKAETQIQKMYGFLVPYTRQNSAGKNSSWIVPPDERMEREPAALPTGQLLKFYRCSQRTMFQAEQLNNSLKWKTDLSSEIIAFYGPPSENTT